MVPEEGRSRSRITASFINEIGPVLVHPVIHRNRLVLTAGSKLATIMSKHWLAVDPYPHGTIVALMMWIVMVES
jgi:hypothetical protein